MRDQSKTKSELIGELKTLREQTTSLQGIKRTCGRFANALRTCNETYRSIVVNSDDAILLTAPNGRIIFANSAACRMFGRTEAEIRQLGREGLVDSKDPVLRKGLETREHTGRFKGELSLVRRDGKRFPGEVTTVVFKDRNRRERTSMVIRDITERKRGEEARRAEEEKFQAIADYTADWENWVGPDGKLLWVNPAAEQMTGYSVAECFAMPTFPLPLLAEKDRAAMSALLDKAVRGTRGNDHEFRFHHKDGTPRWGAISWQPIFSKDGAPLGYRSSIRDINERKRAEEALRESDERFRRLCEAAFEAIAIHEEGVLLSANDQYFKLFGYEPDEMLGKNVITTTVVPAVTEFRTKRIPADGRGLFESIGLRKDGTSFPIEIRARPMEYNGRDVSVAAILDVSDRKRAQEEVERKTEDLFLINSLNAAANRGESLQKIISLLAQQLNRMFSSYATLVFLPSEDKKYLVMQNLSIPETHVYWIEQLMGTRISDVRIALTEESIYRQIWRDGKPKLTNDPEAIQRMRAEFTEDRTLKKFVPRILTFVGVHSLVTVPMIAGDELVGMMDVSRQAPFTETELERIRIIAEDISAILQRKRAEEGTRRAHEELTRLNAHLNKIREEERTRVSREIHDELGQALTTVKIDLHLLQSKLRPDQTDLFRRCQSMEALLNDAIDVVQRVSSQLRPGLLDDLGLGAAIEWQVQEFQRRTGIVGRITGLSDLHALRGDASIELFRIFQEALTNVARHSKATTLDILLAKTNDRLLLEIKDNGVGIDNDKIDGSASLGLKGMRERARSVGGSLSIRGSPGLGTCVRAEVPIEEMSPVNTTNISTGDNR